MKEAVSPYIQFGRKFVVADREDVIDVIINPTPPGDGFTCGRLYDREGQSVIGITGDGGPDNVKEYLDVMPIDEVLDAIERGWQNEFKGLDKISAAMRESYLRFSKIPPR